MCLCITEVSAYGAVPSKTLLAHKFVFLAWGYCIDRGWPNVRNVQVLAAFAALHARQLSRLIKTGDRAQE